MHQKYLPTAKTEVVMHYHLWPPSVLYATQGGSNVKCLPTIKIKKEIEIYSLHQQKVQ